MSEQTPGQAVHQAHYNAVVNGHIGTRPVQYDELGPMGENAWEDIARAGIAAQEQPAPELAALQADLADAEAEFGKWPRCPAGCRCRIGTDDADALECGCDGPCTTGWDVKPAPESSRPFQGQAPLPDGITASVSGTQPPYGQRPASMLQPVDFDDASELTERISIRFPADMISAVRQLAAADGMTVSAWIRHQVEQEAARREQPVPELGTAWRLLDESRAKLATLRAGYDRLRTALEAQVNLWRHEAEPDPEAAGVCANELAQILAAHSEECRENSYPGTPSYHGKD